MRLFVGLGNPGAKYAGTRHNIGFMAVDRIQEDHGFAPWRGKFQGSLSEGRLGAGKVALLKPETFMNLSGQSVGEAMRFYKLTPADVVVFHDELDLAPGKVRVKVGGGHAGHNGLRSIHQHIGPDYGRVRMGIGHPGHKDRVSGFVLSEFAKADADWLDDVLRGCADGAAALAADDPARFSNAVALRVAPPRSGTGQGKGQGQDQGQGQGKGQAKGAGKTAAPKDQAGATPPAPAQAPENREAPQPGAGGAADTGRPAPDPAPTSAPSSALQRLVARFKS